VITLVRRNARSSTLLDLSSDPSADLARSIETFVAEFHEFMTSNPRPMTGHSLARGTEWFTGCDMTALHGPANQMLMTWSRVGQLEVPVG
jgi:hypothetical protein